MGCLDQETRSWFCDIPPTRGVIGYDAGNSEGSLSWLSTNLDLGHPSDLDSPANQVPIECLVKWMVHSPGSLTDLMWCHYNYSSSLYYSDIVQNQDHFRILLKVPVNVYMLLEMEKGKFQFTMVTTIFGDSLNFI